MPAVVNAETRVGPHIERIAPQDFLEVVVRVHVGLVELLGAEADVVALLGRGDVLRTLRRAHGLGAGLREIVLDRRVGELRVEG